MDKSLKRIIPPALALMAGAIVVLPAIIFGMPNNNDLANHYHFAIPFYDALRQGSLYPSWLATPNFGYGDVVVRFYPPALYYLLAAGRFLTGNWYAGSLLVITCLSALGSFGAYVWARSYLPPTVAVWAAVFYALMPYHLAEFYQAAQLAEFAAGAALLFALAFTKRVCDKGRWQDVAGLAAAYAGLVLSHLPLAVFGSLTLLVYALMNCSRPGATAKISRLTVGAILGLGASSFYWITMVSEMKWIFADGVNPDPLLDYRRNFIFSTFSADKQETIWWMGLLAIATIGMCVPSIGAFAKRTLPSRPSNLFALITLLGCSFLMSTTLSKPVWAIVPYLEKTQHPFRWLAVVSAIAPILIAASIPFWAAQLRQHRREFALAMTGLVLIAVTFSVSQTVRGATYLSRSSFERMLAPLRESAGIVQWLPVWASASAQNKPSYEKCTPPAAGAKVEAAGRTIHITQWSDTRRTFEVEAGQPVNAHIATFYYPHWKTIVNGQEQPTQSASDGALAVSLPSTSTSVTLEFREPARAKFSAATAIISWTLVTSLFILGTLANKRRDHEPIAI
jgi:6-pyruvoyl-tetrahydropterin synthase related domain